jgi:hypothetical protein
MTSMMSEKATKGTALTSEMDCDQTAMGFPPVASAEIPIAKLFWKNVGVSVEYL